MAIIKCKMCGGDLNIVEGASTAECEFCGSVQTIPKVDDDKKLTLFARANRLRIACEFDKAAGIYEAIVADFPEEAEAYWGLVLCKYGIEYVDDPATGKKIPTCHRSSFDSIMEDSDFEQALENADGIARKVYREGAKQIEEIRKGIISVSSNEQPYDIFICYKETDENGDRTLDSVLAQDVYDALTDKDYRVFFARITLEDKLGQEYEPYIFAALNSAKIMLAFGTDYEYFNAVWVKNEWSRFLKLMAKDKQKHLIPCYKGIDAYDMPREFARLQAQDLGKVGAMQDLLRGIEKILPRQTETKTVISQTVVTASNPSVDSILQRCFICLEDGDWEDAKRCFDQVLNIDPQNGKAYLGMLLADIKVKTLEELINKDVYFETNSNYKKLLRFAPEEIKETLPQIEKRQEALRLETQRAAEKKQRLQEYEKTHQTEIEEFRKYAKIEDGTLIKFTGKLQQIYLPCEITAIRWYAFSGCKNLTSIVIPESVTDIGYNAFSNCENLTSIVIPESVTGIGSGAFSGCDRLQSIILENNPNFRMIDGCLVDVPNRSVIFGWATATIPNDGSVTSIRGYAFSSCKNLTSIVIPEGVTSIGHNAFSYCGNLTSIVIPKGVTSIESSTFWYCKNLTSIVIPEGVTSIGEFAFSHCENLTSIVIPEGVTSIGEEAFSYCKNLTSIVIPESVTSIGEDAFSHCENLTSIVIPEGVTSIGKFAFWVCKNLTSIVIPESVTSIGVSAFMGCQRLQSIIIENNPNFRMIDGCLVDVPKRNLISGFANATIPDDGSVTSIGEHAFHYCINLTSIAIPESITSIGNHACFECENLTSIVIPESVTSIGAGALESCHPDLCIDTPQDSYAAQWGKKNGIRAENVALRKQLEAERLAQQKREEEERIAQQQREEAERIAQHEREEQQKKIWRLHMQCQHCGGELKGFFSKKCVNCGKPKDY